MDVTRTLKTGDIAPDFSLPDQHEKEVRLSKFQGKRVLLSFHPLAWTPVCAQQMKDLEARKPDFDRLNTVALGISVDPVPSKLAWAEKELHVKDTLLPSDFWPHGRVAHAFGIFREEEGVSERACVIVDEKGTIEFLKLYPIEELPSIADIVAYLEKPRGK